MTDTDVTLQPKVKNAKAGSIAAVVACPELLNWLDKENNEGVDVYSLTAGSKVKVHFKCPECGAPMYRPMYRFLMKQEDGTYHVPVCQNCTPSVRKDRVWLQDAVPDIEMFWNDELNEGHKPSEYSAVSNTKVWTNCPICGTPVRRNVRYTWAPDDNGVGHVIHCRICGKRHQDNALTEIFPEIKDYWLYEKNEHGPDYYTVSSGKKIYILCPECGRERYLAVCDAVTQDGDGICRITVCRECAMRKSLDIRRQKDSNIAKACPEVNLYWDDKNEYSPSELTLHSLTEIYTHCPTCGKLLHRRATNTFKETDGVWHVLQCQKCAALDTARWKAMSKNGPVVLECPEIKEWWDDRNEIGPDKVTRGSHYEAYLTCPACRVQLRRDIHSFISVRRDGRILPVACPECGYSLEGNPEDNLTKVCPDIVNWWDYEANAPFCPEQFSKGSQFMAYLICPDCGMRLYSGIHSLLHTDENGEVVIAHKGKCRKYRAMESENNLVACFPQVKDWWDYEQNKPDLPEEYTLFSSKQMYFKCPACGTRTYRRISDAFAMDDKGLPVLFKCPYCSGAKPTPGVDSLAALYPKLAAECISTDDTERIFPFASSRMGWKCSNCGGEWFDIVANRVNGAGCPYCENRRALSGYNDLATTNPDLASEWSSQNEEGPETVLQTKQVRALWTCPKCHVEYSYIIAERKVGDKACPYCSERKPLSGYNTLKAKHSNLVDEEWATNENALIGLDPDDILDSNSEPAWWKCSKCNHFYTMSAKERLLKMRRGHNPCSFCNGRRIPSPRIIL